jgi:hypothetical protein
VGVCVLKKWREQRACGFSSNWDFFLLLRCLLHYDHFAIPSRPPLILGHVMWSPIFGSSSAGMVSWTHSLTRLLWRYRVKISVLLAWTKYIIICSSIPLCSETLSSLFGSSRYILYIRIHTFHHCISYFGDFRMKCGQL